VEFYEGKLLSNASALPTPEQRFSVAIAHHQFIPPTFLRFPTISFIDMEFCTDPARTIHGANMDSA
jgi:hypothetical protein